MADILNASPALIAPGPSTSRGDETRIRENSGNEVGPAAPVTFAAVLKSRSDKLASGNGGTAPTANRSATATAEGSEVTLATPAIDATALLSRLGSVAAIDPGVDSVDAALLAATPPESLIASDVANSALFPSPGLVPADGDVEKADAPAATTIDAFVLAATDASISIAAPLVVANAVPPAPTSGIPGARGGRSDDTAQRSASSTDVPFDRKAPTDKLAVEPAISAETARTGSQASLSGEGAADFRSTLERIANHSGNLAMQSSGTTSASAPPPSVRVETGFGQAGWNQEMGEKLSWMVGNGRQQADLVLNPPQLGRIEVTMIIEGDNVSASFASPNAAVREALENSMSRLREVLADAGVALGDTHVGADCRQDAGSTQAKDGRNASGNRFGEISTPSVDALTGASPWRNASGRGMVDVFA